jgi:hypothetical protein
MPVYETRKNGRNRVLGALKNAQAANGCDPAQQQGSKTISPDARKKQWISGPLKIPGHEALLIRIKTIGF